MHTVAIRRIELSPPANAAVIGPTVPKEVSRRLPSCSTCTLSSACLSAGVAARSMKQLDDLVKTRIRLPKGDTLYRAGARFSALYSIRSGSCKTVLLAEDGQEHVAGYHIAGDIIGIDGIDDERHECEATALEDTEVCVLPFDQLTRIARDDYLLQHNLHRMLSREITRERRLMLLLGTMHADQRVAAFLLDMSRRYQSRGYSASEFQLRMTREEIGSYLGLKLETVSRLLSRFQREGLIQVLGRGITLLDRVMLRQLLDHSA
jgi:CRP/FNR family transcriptional regulator, anaerobic regulatory protein